MTAIISRTFTCEKAHAALMQATRAKVVSVFTLTFAEVVGAASGLDMKE